MDLPPVAQEDRPKRRTAKIVLFAFIASAVLVAASGRCLIPEYTSVSSSGPALRLGRVLRGADAAVVGRVVDIGPSIRNYSCAMHHVIGEGDEHVTGKLRYTPVRVAVEEVVFYDPKYPRLQPPPIGKSAIDVWYLGDPTAEVADADDSLALRSLPVRLGERRLLFLVYKNILYVDRAGPLVWRGARGGFTWAIRDDGVAYPSLRSVQEDLNGHRFPALTRVEIEPATKGVPLEDLRNLLWDMHARDA